MPEIDEIVLDVIGEGATDIGKDEMGKSIDAPSLPDRGIIPILVHKLCGSPGNMRVVRRKFATLTRHGFPRKLEFGKKQAFYNGSAGVVFVVDTEGKHPAKIKELKAARDS